MRAHVLNPLVPLTVAAGAAVLALAGCGGSGAPATPTAGNAANTASAPAVRREAAGAQDILFYCSPPKGARTCDSTVTVGRYLGPKGDAPRQILARTVLRKGWRATRTGFTIDPPEYRDAFEESCPCDFIVADYGEWDDFTVTISRPLPPAGVKMTVRYERPA